MTYSEADDWVPSRQGCNGRSSTSPWVTLTVRSPLLLNDAGQSGEYQGWRGRRCRIINGRTTQGNPQPS
jgi:hypothetical protein